jgi:hypothetical protein
MLAATTLAQIPLTRCGPLLSSTSLRALGRRRLHPPRAGGLHSHTLGGCAGGGAPGLSLPRAAAEVTVEGTVIGSIRVAATRENAKP